MNDPIKILFVDDEEINIELFKYTFQDQYTVLTALSGAEALELHAGDNDIGIILADYQMAGMTGVELLAKFHELNPDTVRILVTAYAEFNNILEAINQSRIYHCVMKPWKHPQLDLLLKQSVSLWRLTTENKQLLERQQLINSQLQKANERLHHLSLMRIEAQENERKRISVELHDDVGQNLIALKLQLKSLHNLIKQSSNSSIEESVSFMKETLQTIIDSTRNLSHNLSPCIINELGIDHALEGFISRFSRDYKILINPDICEVNQLFSNEQQHHLYRIFQEILNNIGKHSGTDTIDIIMRKDRHILSAVLTDYGCGFDVEKFEYPCRETGKMGLFTIRERVSLLGGKLDIRSTLGKGTIFTLSIPVSKKHPPSFK